MEVLRTRDAFSSCSRERVTAEMPVAASGKHESVLLRERRMGAQTLDLPCAFPLKTPLFVGLNPGLRSIAAGLAREQPRPLPLPSPGSSIPPLPRLCTCRVCAVLGAERPVLAVCRTRNMEGGTAAAFPGRRSAAATAGAGAGSGLDGSHRMMKSSVHAEEDDFVPELQRSIHPRERPDWEETLSAMARGADIPDIPGELPLRSCGSTASMKVKNVKKYIPPGLMGCDAFHRLSFTKGHFPKMAECAHFHYENVDFGNIQMLMKLCTHGRVG
uniref:Uncharacterized protein n=1 Tax=Cyanoderma ruficeps TaxID=181631 RepID=A0A8C3QJY5_9PASS